VTNGVNGHNAQGKLFVASISPQTRASLAAVFNVSEVEAGNMIAQLLSGPSGLKSGGHQGSDFTWVIDTNAMREACLVAAADEVTNALSPEALKASPKPGSEGAIDTTPKAPILTTSLAAQVAASTYRHINQVSTQRTLQRATVSDMASRNHAMFRQETRG
jgi:hypothetical protein